MASMIVHEESFDTKLARRVLLEIQSRHIQKHFDVLDWEDEKLQSYHSRDHLHRHRRQ
jgi:hypothetical protein